MSTSKNQKDNQIKGTIRSTKLKIVLKFICCGVLITSLFSCSNNKVFDPTGKWKSLNSENETMTITKEGSELSIVTTANNEKRPLQWASACKDEKLTAFSEVYSYKDLIECRAIEKDSENRGGGCLIIGEGGEWLNIFTVNQSESLKMQIQFPGVNEYLKELNSVPDYTKAHAKWITMTGKQWLLEKLSNRLICIS